VDIRKNWMTGFSKLSDLNLVKLDKGKDLLSLKA
jgi:hypothetical protein